MSDIGIVIILILVALAALFFLPQLMIKRAIGQVIKIFRQHNAIGIKNAKTIDELGLRPATFFNRMMKPRDYRPRALQALISAGIVQGTEDGKLYLSEDSLAASRLRSY